MPHKSDKEKRKLQGKTGNMQGTATSPQINGIQKSYWKHKNLCRVAFCLPADIAGGAEKVAIAGDFNNWNPATHLMKKKKNGDYVIKLDLEPEREYQFRYVIDDTRWENDRHADRYVQSPYADSENSVVMV